MTITIHDLLFDSNTRQFVEGLVPVSFDTQSVVLDHPFLDYVSVNDIDSFESDKMILLITINSVKSFMVTEDFIEFELDTGEISQFEIKSNNYSRIEAI